MIAYLSQKIDESEARMQSCATMAIRTARTSVKLPSRPPSTVDGKEPLQIRIPIHVKRAFKSHAALQGMEPNELFVVVWEYYERAQASASSGSAAS